MSALTPLRSANQALQKSGCQARTTYIPGMSAFTCLTAVIPVWGFGKFLDGDTGYSGGVYRGVFTWKDTWPKVYNQLVETWTQSDGNGQVTTTTYSPYVDVYRTVSRSTTGTGPVIDGTTYPVSKTVTDTLITITYWADSGHTISGTYTAQLQGSPYDPNDGADGWAVRTDAAADLLDSINIEDINAAIDPSENYRMGWIYPVSYGSGYDFFFLIGGAYQLAASFRGMPFKCFEPGIIQRGSLRNLWLSIYDYPRSYPNPIANYQDQYNEGCTACCKTFWKLNGEDWNYPLPGNTHLNLYGQRLTIDSGGDFVFGTPYDATVIGGNAITNPIPPGYRAFVPQDVIDNNTAQSAASDLGIIGFVGTAH